VRWNVDKDNTLGATLRHSLRRQRGRGSARLEWLQTLGTGLPTAVARATCACTPQLFSGYGDSMIDYNRKRTVLSLGVEPGGLVERAAWPGRRVRKSSVRASRMVVTGTVSDRKMMMSQACNESLSSCAEKYRMDASVTHHDDRLNASAGGCIR
jgi:hypothetical protein